MSGRDAERVSREIERILDHAGLNPNETLGVTTSYLSYVFITQITGVDLELARAALTTHLEGRPVESLVRNGNTLVLTQHDR